MIRFLKAAAWTAVAIGPLALAHWLPRGIATMAVIVYLLILLRVSYTLVWVLDVELPTLRNAELDALLDGVFSDYEADLTRFPFRAHIFHRGGLYPIEWLEMAYSYRTHSTDPDAGIRFFRSWAGREKGSSGKHANRATFATSGATTCPTLRQHFTCAVLRTRQPARSRQFWRCHCGKSSVATARRAAMARSACSVSMCSRPRRLTRWANFSSSSARASSRR